MKQLFQHLLVETIGADGLFACIFAAIATWFADSALRTFRVQPGGASVLLAFSGALVVLVFIVCENDYKAAGVLAAVGVLYAAGRAVGVDRPG